MNKARVVVFAKFPRPGRVKTRLTPFLSPENAARLHLQSLRAVMELTARAGNLQFRLAVTPDEDAMEFREMLSLQDHQVLIQGPGNLGQRLQRISALLFEKIKSPLVFLGADSPTLPPQRINDALTKLTNHDATIGPSTDGGYYLVAMQRHLPQLFENIQWGSRMVTTQTRQQARSHDIKLAEIEPWYDLDRREDLAHIRSHLATRQLDDMPQAHALRDIINSLFEEGKNRE